jgi:hypothetical protein
MKLQNRRLRSGGSPCAQRLVIAEVLEKVHLRLVTEAGSGITLVSKSSQIDVRNDDKKRSKKGLFLFKK